MTPDEVLAAFPPGVLDKALDGTPITLDELRAVALAFYEQGYKSGVRKGAYLLAGAVKPRTNAIAGPQTSTPRGVT